MHTSVAVVVLDNERELRVVVEELDFTVKMSDV